MTALDEVPLGELVEIEDSRRIPLNSRDRAERPGPYPYYGAAKIFDYIDDYIYEGDRILVGEDGSVVRPDGRPYVQHASGRFWVNNHAHVLRPVDGVDFHFLKAALEIANIGGLVTGAAQPKLNQANLKRIPIPLPPEPSQRVIGGLLRGMEGLIENNRRRIEVLEETARLIYREWFVHFRFPCHEDVALVESNLGPIPEGWVVTRIEELCSRLQAGSTPKRSENRFWGRHDADWFKTGELQDDFLFASEEGLSSDGVQNGRMFDAGTILMAIYGSPTVGRLGVLTRPASCNQAALGFVADPARTNQIFLYYKLLELRNYFNSIAQGAAQQNISKEKVAQTTVGLPPSELQRHFADIVTPIWSFRENLGRQMSLLAEARDLLLPRLISGELDVSGLDLDLAPVA